MATLSQARLVTRERSHAPYRLTFEEGTVSLIQAAMNLAVEIGDASAAATRERAGNFQRKVMRAAERDEAVGEDAS